MAGDGRLGQNPWRAVDQFWHYRRQARHARRWSVGHCLRIVTQVIDTTGFWANVYKKPVVFDPVGVGATAHRKAAAKGTL
jgi:hypothetical protein